MSFLYPRTVTISRPNTSATLGLNSPPYGALDPNQETVIATGMQASIQQWRSGTGNRSPEGLPGDAMRRTMWEIFIPDAGLGLINTRDIITDELGVRHQVIAPYWNSLGAKALCERLEI